MKDWDKQVGLSFDKFASENADEFSIYSDTDLLERLFIDDAVETKLEKLVVAQYLQNKYWRFSDRYFTCVSKCQSPIEKAMLSSIYIAATSMCVFDKVDFVDGDVEPEKLADCSGGLLIYNQRRIGRYKADIALYFFDYSWLGTKEDRFIWEKVAIECDGHDYHERTKEQASQDKKRDRFFQSKKYSVLRYSGSDIWKDCLDCAVDAINIGHDKLREKSKEMRQIYMRQNK